MKIIHRVSLRASPEQLELLKSLGIPLKRMDETGITFPDNFVYFDASESDLHWKTLADRLVDWGIQGVVSTRFTTSELKAARLLELNPSWHCGYPQSEADDGYITLTYDTTHYCGKCGAGGKQKAPFRMKGEPKWGKKNILQLNWIFDEYFVKPDLWEAVFRPLGIGFLPVLKYKRDSQLDSVVQLDITQTAGSRLALSDLHPAETCTVCDRKKYVPLTRGMFPHFMSTEHGHLFRTQELFGSGASAWNAIIVSHTLYDSLQKHRVSGVSFVPVGNS